MITEKDEAFRHEPITNQLQLLQQALDWPDISMYQGAIQSYILLVAKVIKLHKYPNTNVYFSGKYS